MTRMRVAGNGIALILLAVLFSPASPAAARGAAPQEQKPAYTIAEYNAYQAARTEKDPQAQIKLLDDFVNKFPNSSLLPYIYQLYYPAYNQQKNFPKVIEYVDKLLAFGDKLDAGTRLQALYTRTLAFNYSFSEKAPTASQDATKAREAALGCLKALGEIQKPANMTDDQFTEQKKAPSALCNYTAGYASMVLKDYKAAVESFQAALASNPTDGVTYFRLGVVYLQENPPESMNGFWALARAVALKGPGEAQVRDYLRKRLLAYQQPGCDSLIDSQMNDMIQLAGQAPTPPAGYSIPSAADLDKVRQASNILTVLSDLQAGGDKAKVTWLTVCGSEFPEVVGKVIEATPATDNVQLKVFTGPTPEAMEAATTANMDVKVEGQPEVSRLQKDDGVRFSGTLASFDTQPFLLHWEKAKVNPEDIPAEKAAPGTHKPHKVPPKK